MRLIYSPDPVRSAIKRGPSDGEFSPASDERYEDLIGGTLVLVGSASRTSKLRLGLLDENTERNFCLNHFLGDCSLLEGVDMVIESDNAQYLLWTGRQLWEIDKVTLWYPGSLIICTAKITLQIRKNKPFFFLKKRVHEKDWMSSLM